MYTDPFETAKGRAAQEERGGGAYRCCGTSVRKAARLSEESSTSIATTSSSQWERQGSALAALLPLVRLQIRMIGPP